MFHFNLGMFIGSVLQNAQKPQKCQIFQTMCSLFIFYTNFQEKTVLEKFLYSKKILVVYFSIEKKNQLG